MTDKYQALREALEDGSASGSWKDRRAIRALLRDHDEWRLQAQYETDVAQAAIEQVKKLEAQRDALLAVARRAVVALAAASERDPSFTADYNAVDKEIRAALSQGEKT